jgi:hypothetical protein
MKALLVTTVEREAQETMGKEPREFNQIKIIPWKEVSEIELTKAGHYTITCLEGPTIEACSLKPIDLREPDAWIAIDEDRGHLFDIVPEMMEDKE